MHCISAIRSVLFALVLASLLLGGVPASAAPKTTSAATQASPLASGCTGTACTFYVSSGSDDAGGHYLCGNRVDWPEVYLGECDDNTPITSGFRFANVTIPQGMRIVDAYLEFTVDGPYRSDMAVDFYAEATADGDADPFTLADMPADRATLPLAIPWHIPSTDVWQVGQTRRSPALTPIVQQIINAGNWRSGNALAIIVKNNTVYTSDPGFTFDLRSRRVIGYERAQDQYVEGGINTAERLKVTIAPVAQDQRGQDPGHFLYSVPHKTENLFTVDTGINLDRYLFRDQVSHGILTFTIDIDRYYSKYMDQVNAQGFLNPEILQDLTAKHILPEKASLTMAVYDVDDQDVVCPETDTIDINGVQLTMPTESGDNGATTLSGGNGKWQLVTYDVPIGMLKFPVAPGDPKASNQDERRPKPTHNTIGITVDAKCGGTWGVAVDWASLSVSNPGDPDGPSVHPILFVHGWTGVPESFAVFSEQAGIDGIPNVLVDMEDGIHPIADDGDLLHTAITQALQTYGVDKIDLIAHSKGGVDSRVALQDNDIAAHVAHLITLSSPHHGSLGPIAQVGFPAPLYLDWLISSPCDSYPAGEDVACKTSAQELTPGGMLAINYRNCNMIQEATLSGDLPIYDGCIPRWIQQPNVDYRSLSGGIVFNAVGDASNETATYPWLSRSWQEQAQPLPVEPNVDTIFTDVAHSPTEVTVPLVDVTVKVEGINTDPRVYRCAISYIEERIWPRTDCPVTDNATQASVTRSVAPNEIVPATATEPDSIDQMSTAQTILSLSGNLLPNATQTFSASVDSGSSAIFKVISSSPITFTLVDPSGRAINPSLVPNDPAMAYIAMHVADYGNIWEYEYQIQNPAVGAWQNIIQTTDAAWFGVWNAVNSPLQLHTGTDRLTYRSGDLVTVEAALTDGTTARVGAVITGTLTQLDDTQVGLLFYDDGTHGDSAAADGRFTTQTIAANVTGYATITVKASQGDVTRIEGMTIGIAMPTAHFRGVASETTTDADGDHLYDSLNLTISMTTVISGHFGLAGTLIDADGLPIASSVTASRTAGNGPLGAGDHAVTLAFEGETIRTSGRPGPYTLTDLRITDETTGTFEVEWNTNVYTTTTYQPSQFEGPQLTLLGATEAPSDTDGDTLANQLNVQLTLDVIFPGEYAWSGRLLDGQGAQIGWANGAGHLDNQTPLVLSFDGQDIRNHGQNGPYVVSGVVIYQTDGGNASAFFGTAYTTAAYDRLTFDVNACIDMHEPDNTGALAQSFAPGETQTHAFCTYDDQDWVTFTADAGVPYRIETLNLASGVDTVLELYTGDGQTLLQSNDNGSTDLRSQIEFMPSVSGTYLVKAHPKEPAGDPSFTYDVRIGPLPLPTLTFDSLAATTNENGGSVAVTTHLSAAFAYTVTVDYATSDETATANSDYTTTHGMLTFAPGETSKTVLVPILEDVLGESDETFAFSLSNPINTILGEPAHTTITILTNDTLSLSAVSYSVQESAGMATITVKLNGPASQPVTVHYATHDGTATAGSDYTATSGTLTFAPGKMSKTFKIPITDDTIGEEAETILLSLSNPNNAALDMLDSATLTIKANDTLTFSTSSANVQEATGAVTMTVKLNAPADHPVMVDYLTIDGTATAGSDYTPISGTLTFAPGELRKTVTVPILDDTVGESNETFGLSLSSPTNATLGTPANATMTIKANDTLMLSASKYRVSEYDDVATITVKLNAPSSQPVTVEYATNDGTAIAGDDYTATSGMLTFAPGETSQTFTIPISYDYVYERNETVQIVVRNPSNAGLGTLPTATLTITNASGGGT